MQWLRRIVDKGDGGVRIKIKARETCVSPSTVKVLVRHGLVVEHYKKVFVLEHSITGLYPHAVATEAGRVFIARAKPTEE
jgi:hypothetical protein